jgi:hypothetical protein
MTDLNFRTLCAELADSLEDWLSSNSIGGISLDDGTDAELIFRARAALAQPEPQEPTDEELMALMPQQLRDDLATASRLAAYGTDVAPGLYRVTLNTGILDHCRAVLARWGK